MPAVPGAEEPGLGPGQGGAPSAGLPGFHPVHLALGAYLRDQVYAAIFHKNPKAVRNCTRMAALLQGLQTRGPPLLHGQRKAGTKGRSH